MLYATQFHIFFHSYQPHGVLLISSAATSLENSHKTKRTDALTCAFKTASLDLKKKTHLATELLQISTLPSLSTACYTPSLITIRLRTKMNWTELTKIEKPPQDFMLAYHFKFGQNPSGSVQEN